MFILFDTKSTSKKANINKWDYIKQKASSQQDKQSPNAKVTYRKG